jgi:hypothetical protein
MSIATRISGLDGDAEAGDGAGHDLRGEGWVEAHAPVIVAESNIPLAGLAERSGLQGGCLRLRKPDQRCEESGCSMSRSRAPQAPER